MSIFNRSIVIYDSCNIRSTFSKYFNIKKSSLSFFSLKINSQKMRPISGYHLSSQIRHSKSIWKQQLLNLLARVIHLLNTNYINKFILRKESLLKIPISILPSIKKFLVPVRLKNLQLNEHTQQTNRLSRWSFNVKMYCFCCKLIFILYM